VPHDAHRFAELAALLFHRAVDVDDVVRVGLTVRVYPREDISLRVAKTRQDAAAVALIHREWHRLDTGIFVAQFVDDGARIVARPVIHHAQFVINARLFEDAAHSSHYLPQVPCLIVGGNDD